MGKSMLFNKLIGKRLSIVEDTPGVTRDRIYGETDWNGRKFTLIDTGGIEPRTDNMILEFMRQQAQIAIEMCIRDSCSPARQTGRRRRKCWPGRCRT